jgi:hypothetical protein
MPRWWRSLAAALSVTASLYVCLELQRGSNKASTSPHLTVNVLNIAFVGALRLFQQLCCGGCGPQGRCCVAACWIVPEAAVILFGVLVVLLDDRDQAVQLPYAVTLVALASATVVLCKCTDDVM